MIFLGGNLEDDIAAIKQSWKAKKAELATLKKEFEDLAEPTCERNKEIFIHFFFHLLLTILKSFKF